MATAKGAASVDRVALIRRVFEEQSLDSATRLFSANYVSHEPWDLAVERSAGREGKEGEQKVLDTHVVFSGMEVSVEDAVEDGDNIIVRWRLRGKWTEPLPFSRIKPSGQPVDVTGVTVYRFVGRKVVESWAQVDTVTLARQMLGGQNIACGSAECVEALEGIYPPDTLTLAQQMFEGLRTTCGSSECVELLPVMESLEALARPSELPAAAGRRP